MVTVESLNDAFKQMNKFIHIVFVLLCFSAFGQDWRDSLTVARDAYKKADYSKALKYYESAQKKAPENVDLSDEMAQSAYKAREFEKAEKIYQQSGNSKSSNLKKADNFHNLGNARMKSKNYQGAIDAYKESLRLNPNDNNTRYNLSEAIRQLKNEEKKQENKQDQNNQDQNKQNQNKQDQNKKDEEKKQQQNQQNQQNQNQSGKPKEGEGEPKENSKGQLPNKTVDRMLDKLMKDEAETKRKMNGTNGKNQTPKSGKDW